MKINRSEREAVLYTFWERTTAIHPQLKSTASIDQWNHEVYHLSQSGIGTEEALTYLYKQRPTFDVFLLWLQNHAVRGNSITEVYEGNVLTEEDWEFWNKNGYIIVKNAIPTEQCVAAKTAIWEYLGADPTQKDSWYQDHEGKNGMMLRFFQHTALDKNRNATKIRKAFEELYNGADIYLLIDKVSFNPPETQSYKFKGSALHWDVSLQLPIPFVLQGLLYLNDVTTDDGAFHCVPGFHKEIDNWILSLPENINLREIAAQELSPIPVPAQAGDLIIWHQALPHCATANKGISPRMVQYITYNPVKRETSPIWK